MRPSELDLIAKRSGKSLHDRWTNWNRSPFTGEHIAQLDLESRPAEARYNRGPRRGD